ncbi:helix-turn-helix domain-containing protein [Pseudomonas chlororaphis]|uniref:helix-turn-helix domain-containing protein n=1 Tax=Pseudomonas chlororaphis TaxID=587753 RepID=UPI000BBB212F|nr:helix-turn-helix domain-containing protein [Pseudomonas chlororaphis]
MNTAKIPSDPALRWEWIKYQLRARGTSLAQLARELNVSGPAIKNVKRTAYPRMERAIAEALGLKPAEIWPERWATNDAPHRTRQNRAERNAVSSKDHNPLYDLRHCKAVTRA